MADSGYGCSRRKIEIKIKSAVKTMLLFGYLFNFRPYFLPGWGQSKLISFFAVMMLAVLGNPVIKITKTFTVIKIKKLIFYQAVLVAYSFFIILRIGLGTGDSFLTYIVRFCVFGIGGAFIFFLCFQDLNEFMKCLQGAVFLQAVMIVLFILFPAFQLKIDELFVTVANTENAALRARGYITGIGCTASAGFLKMAPGIAAGIYLVFTDCHFIKNISMLFFLFITGTLLARTGFVFAVFGLLILLYGAGRNRMLLKKTMLSVAAALALLAVICSIFDLSSLFGRVFSRLERLLTEGFNDPFFSSYQRGSSAVIPELSWDTIMGIGVVSGCSGNGIRIEGVDGGYLRLYAAIGLPLMIVTYAVLLWMLFLSVWKIKDKKFQCVMIFMLFYMVLGEMKEFLIYTGFAIGIFYAMLMMHESEKAENTGAGCLAMQGELKEEGLIIHYD